MSRTVNDWGSLVLSELDGHEQPGTVARLLAAATGKVAVAADDVAASALLKLAEKLSAPATVQKQIKDLALAGDAARTEQARLAKLRKDYNDELESAHAEHTATIERELKDHEAAMTAARAELAAAKKETADLLARARADAEVAARLKDRAAKKLAAFDAA